MSVGLYARIPVRRYASAGIIYRRLVCVCVCACVRACLSVTRRYCSKAAARIELNLRMASLDLWKLGYIQNIRSSIGIIFGRTGGP